MKLRCFFTLHEIHGASSMNPRWSHEQKQEDFPTQMEPKAAYRMLFAKYGKLDDSTVTEEIMMGQRIKIAPTRFIEIHSHTVVDDERPAVVLESERRREVGLFDGVEYKNTLSRKPENPYLKTKRTRK